MVALVDRTGSNCRGKKAHGRRNAIMAFKWPSLMVWVYAKLRFVFSVYSTSDNIRSADTACLYYAYIGIALLACV